MIQKLSNQELDANLKRLVAGERKILHVILQHILEVDARKLYLDKAHSSLYEYLVKECGYSGSAAMRRISAARLMKDVPAIGTEIQAGSLNLSQVSELSRAIKEKEKLGVVVSLNQRQELVASISGKTTQESQKEISLGLDIQLKAPEKTFVQKDESVHLQITLSAGQYQQLLECRDLAASELLTENQDASLASVVGHLAKCFLILKKKTLGRSELAFADKKLNKTLTPKTRANILHRDQCCQFRDPLTGKVCGSTFNLEIDHKRPRWAQGSHAPNNLQVLCRAHNNHKYRAENNLSLTS
jgi:hypothetical protein